MTHKCYLAGRLNNARWVSLSSLAAAGVLIFLLWWRPESSTKPRPGEADREPLLVYCAAGIKPPVEAVAREYEEAFGVPVQLQFGGSEYLLGQAELSRRGDLFLPADDSYTAKARSKGLVDETLPLARVRPVLAVKKGNPKRIAALADLLRADVSLGIPDSEVTASGKLVRQRLARTGQWQPLDAKKKASKPTVNEVANDIVLGAVDAGFVWDAIVSQTPQLETVRLPQLDGVTAQVEVSVLKSSKQPTAALHFARYLAARDKGLITFKKGGYEPAAGDEWADKPELRLLAGAMLRPAIDETIDAFEKREGVVVNRVYNGCGILVSQMKLGEQPDAFFSCDQTFLDMVGDRFPQPVEIARNRLVILVPKGNPLTIRGLDDLAAPGRRVGVGDPERSALGVLTKKVLDEAKLADAIRSNVVVESPTGDYLVNQLRAEAVDAVIAYASNGATVADKVDAVKINADAGIATQPFAIEKGTRYKQLAGRLLDALRSPASRARFESAGFQWSASRP